MVGSPDAKVCPVTQPRILTRHELYDLVWSKPVIRLAEEFGISDVGLKKICDRHDIPTPPLSYWSKHAVGKAPRQTPLPSFEDPRFDRIEIGAGVARLPEPVRQVLKRRKLERMSRKRQTPEQIEPVVPLREPIRDVHPSVARTAKALRRIKPGADSIAAFGEGLCGLEVGSASVERAIAVLDGLARALEAKVLKLLPIGKGMKVEVGEDSAVFVLKEQTRTVPHTPTSKELEEEKRREEQRQRHWRDPMRWPAPPYGQTYPKFDTIWTGELAIQIEGYADGVRRRWSDGRRQRLEDLATGIAEGIEVLLAVRKADREAREERSRQWAEMERRRKLARARTEREAARHRFFDELALSFEKARSLGSSLASWPTKQGDDSPHIARMLGWAEGQLFELEQGLRVEVIEKRLADAKLFPEIADDELHDPLGDPPNSIW